MFGVTCILLSPRLDADFRANARARHYLFIMAVLGTGMGPSSGAWRFWYGAKRGFGSAARRDGIPSVFA